MEIVITPVTEPKTDSKVTPIYEELEEQVTEYFSELHFGKDITIIHFALIFVPNRIPIDYFSNKVSLDEKTLHILIRLNHRIVKGYLPDDIKIVLGYEIVNSFFNFNFQGIDFDWKNFILILKQRLEKTYLPKDHTIMLKQNIN